LTADEVKRLYLDTIDGALFKVEGPDVALDGLGMTLSWPPDPNYVYFMSCRRTMPLQPTGSRRSKLQRLPATTPTNTVYLPIENTPTRLFRVVASPKSD